MTDNTALSIAELQQKAQAGDAQAQLNLAYRLEKGEGIDKNMELAFYWLSQAAESGNAGAQYELGISERFFSLQYLSESRDCYRWLNISNVNSDEAFSWILKSAEKNYAKAQYVAAMCYFKGDGTQKNPELGVNWLMKAAENSLPLAQQLLSRLYGTGEYLELNKSLAFEWLEKAATAGLAEAQYELAYSYRQGETVQQNNDLACEWARKVVEQEQSQEEGYYGAACVLLAELYADGNGIMQSDKQAYVWRKKAAENGHAESQYWLSYYLLTGGILEQTQEPMTHIDRYSKADQLAYCAAEGGCLKAKLILGFMQRFEFWGVDVVGSDIAIEFFEGAVGRSDKGIAEYFLYEYYRHSDDPEKRVLANNYEKQADIKKVWEYFKIDRLIEMDGSLKEKLAVLLKDAELIQKNKELERANRELEELMAMFAHKFRSPLDAILYNTTHDNQVKLYTEAAQIMRGLLDVFSAISTDTEMLRNRIRQDKQGKGRLSTLFIKTLDMMMLHLLSVSGSEKIQQHYLTYAKSHELCDPELSDENWREDYLELEEELQSQWEKGYAELLNNSSELEPRLVWLEQHFFKLDIDGFDNEAIQFRANGVTESFLMILLNEIMVNAFKYYSSTTKKPVALEWVDRDGFQVLICRNPSTRSERDTIKGSGKGHAFLSALAHKTGSRFIKPLPEDDFVTEFEIPNELLLVK